MGKAQMVNEASIAPSVAHRFPGIKTLETIAEERNRRPWHIRAAMWTGVIMAAPDKGPNAWSFNPATATLALVVLGLVAGGSWYLGNRDAEMRHLQDQIKKAGDDAAKAKQLETYNAGSVDAMKGHANSNTEKKK